MTPDYLIPSQVKSLIDSDSAAIVDVRELIEYHELHVDGSIHIPLSEIRSGTGLLSELDKDIIVMICRIGRRSHIACEIAFEEQVPKKIYNMQGGINAWVEAGLAVVRGK